jgi:hypothetical protein
MLALFAWTSAFFLFERKSHHIPGKLYIQADNAYD